MSDPLIASEPHPDSVSKDSRGLLESWALPGSTPRKEQVRIIDFIEQNEDKDVLLVEAPTGTGKSPICMTLANARSGTILTPQKILQDQYVRDWPDVPLVTGMTNYRCRRFPASGLEDSLPYEASCEANSQFCGDYKNRVDSACPYRLAADSFYAARTGITNYSFLFNLLSRQFNEARDKLRAEWFLFDEGHELESQLISASEVSFDEKSLDDLDLSPPLAGVLTQENSITYMEMVISALTAKVDVLRRDLGLGAEFSGPKVHESRVASLMKQFSHYTGLLTRCRGMVSSVSSGYEWVTHSTGKGFFSKPLWVNGLFSEFIRPLGKKILITSATMVPPKLMGRWFGWEEGTYSYIGVDSPFPVNNRPVYFKPVAALNKRNMEQMLPDVVKYIDKVLSRYPDSKGVIHCHSFDLGEQIVKLSRLLPARMTHHRYGMDREKILQLHCTSDRPSVLISPSMTEGIDLKDDLARFVIFPKMPYPSLGDPWVRRRQECDEEWYNYQVIKTVIQGCGRAVRHANDYADSYIFDSNFQRLLDNYSHCFPTWFKKAILIK